VHGSVHVRYQMHIDYNLQARQHTILSTSQSCCEYHKPLLLAQLDNCLHISVRIASQSRASNPAHYSIHVPSCSSNSLTHGSIHVPTCSSKSLTHAVACSVLDNMMELPVNVANHMADFASQLFSHLSGMNVAGVREVSRNATPLLTMLSSVHS